MDDDLAAQFSRMGVVVEGAAAAPAPEAFEVMGQNVAALRVWLDCEHQWRVAAGMGGIVWLGLDLVAVDVVLRRSGTERADEVFADIVLMEAAAMEVLGKADT
jgi:hypothetical protein